MKREKSCGALCFAREDGVEKVLMVKHRAGGHWAFPKGHVERGETEEQTACREVREETGVKIEIDPGYREISTYSPCRGTLKDVIYFAAHTADTRTRPQPEEVEIARFVPVDEAAALLTFDVDRGLLKKALAAQKRG